MTTTEKQLAPTCSGCGCETSTSWVFVSGTTKPGPYPFREHGVPARTLLCEDCRNEHEERLLEFLDSLQDGYSRMDQGPDVTVLTYPDGRQEVYPTMPKEGTHNDVR